MKCDKCCMSHMREPAPCGTCTNVEGGAMYGIMVTDRLYFCRLHYVVRPLVGASGHSGLPSCP